MTPWRQRLHSLSRRVTGPTAELLHGERSVPYIQSETFSVNLSSLSSLIALNTDKLNSTSGLRFKQNLSTKKKLNKWVYNKTYFIYIYIYKTSFTYSKQIQTKAANIQDSVGIVSHIMTMLQNMKPISKSVFFPSIIIKLSTVISWP